MCGARGHPGDANDLRLPPGPDEHGALPATGLQLAGPSGRGSRGGVCARSQGAGCCCPGQAHLLKSEGSPRLQVRRPPGGWSALSARTTGPSGCGGQSIEAWNCGSSAERPLPDLPNADLRRPAEAGHRAAVTATATPNQQPNCPDPRAPATPGAAGSRGEGGRAFGSARAREPPLGPPSPSRLQEAGEDARLSQSAEFWGDRHTATDNSRSPGSLFFLLCVTAAAGKRGRLRAETDLCVSTGQRCSRGF